jgi:MarR family transcriptional regulator, organic hydroperoxide resistance regulator
VARPDAEFLETFWATKHALASAWMAAFSAHGVHEGQQFVLRCLWEEDGLAPGEVAKRLGLATPTVTRAATRMEAAGLLRRQPHPIDRRLVRLVLTPKGRALEEVIDREMASLSARALAGLSAREKTALVGSLTTIRENLARRRSAAV